MSDRRHEAGAAAKAAAQITGVAKVLHADAPQLRDFLAENVAAVVVSVAKKLFAPPRAVHVQRKERHAARRGAAGRAADLGLVRVEGADTFVRPIYAGTRSPR